MELASMPVSTFRFEPTYAACILTSRELWEFENRYIRKRMFFSETSIYLAVQAEHMEVKVGLTS
jgi:hypothetical protein